MSIDATKIKTLSQRDHAIMRKSMYIGSEELQQSGPSLFTATGSFQEQTQKLFDEVFQNALDNYVRSDVSSYYINVVVKPREFIVKNNGNVFNLKTEAKRQSIIRVFSEFNTSSQYGEEQNVGSGRNGLGAKLVNVLSEKFEVFNTSQGQRFEAKFQRGVLVSSSLTPCEGEDSFTVHVQLLPPGTVLGEQVKCVQNFADFNIEMIHQYLTVVQCIYPEIKLTFNSHALPRLSFKALLEKVGVEQYYIFKHRQLQIAIFKKDANTVSRYSLINGNQTFDTQGIHYTKLQKQMKEQFKIKDTLSCGMIVLGNVPTIDYSDQTKTKISKFPEIKPLPEELGEFIRNVLCAKKAKKNYAQLFDQKLIEANVRGPGATLILTEGDSAATLFRAIGAKIDGFFDKYGIFPLRGKVQNVVKDGEFDDKSELQKIMNIMGLQSGVDYGVESNRKTLRYGHILIASDYDVDGFHIKGLLINFVHHYWPVLLDAGLLQEFITPIIMAQEGTTWKEFFSEADFADYRDTHTVRSVKYFKGLGTFQERDQARIGAHFKDYIKQIVWSNKDLEEKYIDVLFQKESQGRKKLIALYRPIKGKNRAQESIDVQYLMSQVSEYAVASLDRAIPDFIDGLKDVQRKIVYYFMTHPENDGVKVSTLQGRVSSAYDYHHGDTSMEGAIVKLAQDFAGANNCNLLEPLGGFGIRFDPRNASPRYIYTKGSKWLSLLFDKNEKLIYEYNLSDDGAPIEPKRLFPLVPLALVNGANGISTGWSSFIPSYKLEDVVKCVKSWLQTGRVPEITPWYRDYNGTVYENDGEYVCEGKYEYNEPPQGDRREPTLTIYDTHILTDQTTLKGYLVKNKLPYQMKRDRIIITASKQEAIAIIKKFQRCVLSLKNITLLHYRDKQIVQYHGITDYIKDWCSYRLEYQEQKRGELLKHMLRDYARLWFLHAFTREGYIEEQPCSAFLRNKDKMTELLKYFPTDVEINALDFTEIEDLKRWLALFPQERGEGSRDYITKKTIGFFTRELPRLEACEEDYERVHERSARQMWIEQLDTLL